MYYQLLGKPAFKAPPNYRGAYRFGPTYQDGLPGTAPANRAWREYIDHDMRLPTRELALRLAAEFEQAGQCYDVVQVEVMPNPPEHDLPGQLGFDISQYGGYSLLSWGLHWNDHPSLPPPPKGPLFKLIEAYFRPLLNENGLFARWSDARFFLDVAAAISALAPGTWESRGHEQFEIVRLVCIGLGAGGLGESDTDPAEREQAGGGT